MARHKGVDWSLPEKLTEWQQVNTTILMDIRDELKTSNDYNMRLLRILECRNFLDIPNRLSAIQKNTTKAKRKQVKK